MRRIDVSCDLFGELPELDLGLDEHNRIVVARPVVLRPEHGLIEAWPRSALVVPAPWTGQRHPISALLHAVHEARRMTAGCVVVVGWTATGEEPPAVAKHRTAAVAALLGNDASAWTSIATEHGSLADVLAYVDYLGRDRGFACTADHISPIESDATKAAIASFQTDYNARFSKSIDVDGVCGEQTLGAVFDVLRFEWDRWLAKHGLTEQDVAAVRFEYAEALDRGLAHAPTESDGGIDLLVVEQFALGGRPIDLNALYGAGVARHTPYVVPPEPGGWQSGPYTVITDVVRGEELLPEIYNLRATDGSFAQGLILPDEAFDNGFLELRFTDIPCDRRYRLDVEIIGVGTYEIFADLAYAELHAFAQTGGQQEG